MTMTAGISTDRLHAWEDHLRATYLDTGVLPNALTLVYRRGEIVHQHAQGFADVEAGVALRDDHIFRIYSMTKPITSLAFMMLVEDGKVALGDPVSRVIPEWANLGVWTGGELGRFTSEPPRRPMLMVDLLRHTAGLSYHIQQGGRLDGAYRALGLGTTTTLEGMITALADLPLEYAPGEAWHYSFATDVLGAVVGRIAEQPFEEFVRQRILGPLGMVDTDFSVAPDKAGRFMPCYALTPQGRVLYDARATSPYLAAPHFVSGGGGLVSTAADYLRFCRMLLRGGELDGARLIGPKTLELMTRNHLPGGADIATLMRSAIAASETGSAGVGFGLGFAVTLDPARSLRIGNAGDFYWGGAAGTYFWIDPTEDLAVIFMTQLLLSPDRVRDDLRTFVYSAITDSPTRPRTLA
ncbi:CubicO group peptidase (beta-lactamase class C family) [Deinococcus metalli]|uniref:CubicO group peptidase (Beta-lactamase class C family) n=1 Tax=Deinococcus metalli TaxID=1141878 RepID=A0A7W8NQE7_9DEIO|nr:serine hydrolase domain-containing protein [Deinococcus metalli]MBB5376715.1 CubicO group peptidase (beta-lactamase class C family) [Deinococcus metalli]GHF44799.1 serine hydrolase [Deinococcus metalli]